MIQGGVEVALGMKYKVLNSAAEIFVGTFNLEIFGFGRSIWSAAQKARALLHTSNKRSTRFNSSVAVNDSITPILLAEHCPDAAHVGQVSTTTFTPSQITEKDIMGREADILTLETKMSKANMLLLCGTAGCGKTFLAQHLCWWWKATRFIDGFLTVDCSAKSNFTIASMVPSIRTQHSCLQNLCDSELVELFNRQRFLLVLTVCTSSIPKTKTF